MAGKKDTKRVNLNVAPVKVIATSFLGIGNKLAKDIVNLQEHIANEQGRFLEVADLVQIPEACISHAFLMKHEKQTLIVVLFALMRL